MLKQDQSILPQAEPRPDSTSYYQIASFCADCRCHLTVTVDFRTSRSEMLCPNEHYPLHHFRYEGSGAHHRPKPTNSVQDQHWEEHHRFVCSSPECSVIVETLFRPPRLERKHLLLLTDPLKVKQRAKQAIDRSPERLKGYVPPEPIVVLSHMKQYLTDALKQTQTGFPANNKKFITSLGEPCRPLLEYLGFRSEGDPEYVCDQLA